eukprot:7144172-Prorocentrum_lima.AAC.1
MVKQQLRHITEPLPSRRDTAVQEHAVESSLHGISNPASGGLKSVPVSGKEVADSKGEAVTEW